MSSELFKPIKELVRQPIRPLGELSDLVAGGLAGREAGELAALVERKIPGLELSQLTDQSADIAGLDAKMLEASIERLGGNPGRRLIGLVDTLSTRTNQPPTITYEEIVILNPENDPRTFTKGEVRQSEKDFYRGHYLIEDILQEAIEAIAAGEIEAAAAEIVRSVETVRVIGHAMPKNHFGDFRKFLEGVRGLPGPSGLYTARIPILDIMFAGDKFPQNYFDFLEQRLDYYPREGRQEMMKAAKEQSLITQYQLLGSPEQMGNQLKALKESLLLFRGVHYGAVKNQVPGALSGEASGTGGEINPRQFLTDRIQMIQGVKI